MANNRKIVKSPEERFWEQVQKGDGCWEWQGACAGRDRNRPHFSLWDGEGHAQQWLSGYRFAYELTGEAIPAGMLICHTCDNPLCVRNDDAGWYEVNGVLHPRRGHLWLGTHADNTADMMAKGRHGTQGHFANGGRWPAGAYVAGRTDGSGKFTSHHHMLMRHLRERGVPQVEIAARFGINRCYLNRVLNGKCGKAVAA